MTALLPTTARKICWFSLYSLFNSNKDKTEESNSQQEEEEEEEDQPLEGKLRRRLHNSQNSNKKLTSISNNNNNNSSYSEPDLSTNQNCYKNNKKSNNSNNNNSNNGKIKDQSTPIYENEISQELIHQSYIESTLNELNFISIFKVCSNIICKVMGVGTGTNSPNSNLDGSLEKKDSSCSSNTLLGNSSPGNSCGKLITEISADQNSILGKLSTLWCNIIFAPRSKDTESREKQKRVLDFAEAPHYLKFNPFITGGYRSSLHPSECIKSLFWLTNETLNIWTHLLGWIFFIGLMIYDCFGYLDLPYVEAWDKKVIASLLVSFQFCMLFSSLYHIFCCCSEKYYKRMLSIDLFGVSLSLLGIYISGIYYAFSCVPFWLNFYLITVGIIATSAILMCLLPKVHSEEKFQWRLIVFGFWGVYGIVPTAHWAFLHGGFQSEAVALLLPRIFGMYIISGLAFFFYLSKFPERFYPGSVNYFFSSHQIWHVLIVLSLYHWHNTGLIYLEFRSTHPCKDEYAALFPDEAIVEN